MAGCKKLQLLLTTIAGRILVLPPNFMSWWETAYDNGDSATKASATRIVANQVIRIIHYFPSVLAHTSIYNTTDGYVFSRIKHL